MHPSSRFHNQAGFSLIEMMVAITIMLVVTIAVAQVIKSSMLIATTNLELTDAQESLRSSQEYINRDLRNTGDGLKSMSTIRIQTLFVTRYLAITPIVDPAMPAGVTNLGLMTSDNNVPAATNVRDTLPVLTVRSTPVLTDRQTILEIDSDFAPIPLAAGAINPATGTIVVPDRTRFTSGVNEVYFLTSALGGAFGTLGTVTAGAGTVGTLTFGAGDFFALNALGAAGPVGYISNNGALATSLVRMKIIHYYINSNGMLMRRVFGVRGVGFRESAIAEHVVSVQFIYALGPDALGNRRQPVAVLTSLDQQISVRQVGVTITVETTHTLQNGLRQQMSTTTSTTMRNMQFRQAKQPTAVV